MAEDTMWLDVLPSMAKMGPALSKGIMGPAKQAGMVGGKAMTAAFSSELDTGTTQAFVNDLQKKSNQLQKTISSESAAVSKARGAQADASAKVRLAEQKLADARNKFGSDSAQALAAEDRLTGARDRHEAATTTLTAKTDQLKAAQRESTALSKELADAQKNVTTQVESSASAFDGLGEAALGAGIAAGAALGKGLYDSMDAEAATNKVTAQLGLTVPESERVGQVAGSLFAGAYGESMDDVSQSVSSVIGNIGGMAEASNAELESITAQVMSLTETFDQDLGGVTTAVGQMMRTGMAPDAQSALDILTVGFQSSTRAGEDLTDTMTEYPALFERLGLSGETAMGIITQGMQAGARNTDLVADALKEFQIRATDGSKLSAEGFATLGLNASEMTKQIAAGGDQATQGLDMVLDALRATEDPVERNAAAVALFGTQAEDLGSALFALDPSSAVDALGQVGGAAEGVDETLNQGAGVAVKELGRILQTELTNAVAVALPYIKGGIDLLKQWQPVITPLIFAMGAFAAVVGAVKVSMAVAAIAQAAYAGATGATAAAQGGSTAALIAYRVAQGASTAFTWVATAAQWAWNAALTANPIGIIIVAIAALVGALVWFFTQTELGQQIWTTVWAGIKTAAGAVVSWFQTSVMPVLTAVWNGIAAGATWLYQNVILPVWNGIQTAIGIVVTIVTGYVTAWVWAFQNVVAPVFTWLYQSIILPVWNGIKLAIQIWWSVTSAVFSLAVNVIRTTFAAVWTWLRDSVILPVWNGIQWAINAAWNFIRTWIFQPIVAFVRDQIEPRFRMFQATITYVWAQVRLGMHLAWAWIRANVFQPIVAFVRDQIEPRFRMFQATVYTVWGNVQAKLQNVWNWIKSNVFSPLEHVVKSALPDAFERGRDAIGKAWDGLRALARKPIAFVVETIIRDGLVKPFNKVADVFDATPIDEKLFTVPKLATGGRVPGSSPSPTADNIPIWATAGEFMVRHAATSRMNREHPGVLDHINRFGTIPQVFGYAKGGIVQLGKALQKVGVRVAGHTAFPPVGRHTTNSEHYVDRAIDLNYGPGGQNAVETAFFNRLAPILHNLGWGVLWKWKGHFGHLHVGTNQKSLGDWNRNAPAGALAGGLAKALEGLGNMAGGAVNALIDLNPFKGLVDKIKSGVGGSPFAQMVGSGATNLVNKAVSWMQEKMPFAGDHGANDPGPQGGGVQRWAGLVREALAHVGQPTTESMVNTVLRRMNQESSGNPRAINNWDINARRGDPSKGLMQVIGGTFAAYRDRSLGNNIWDPFQNIVASMRYALSRYGSLPKAYNRRGGYADGGMIEPTLFDDGGYIPPGLSMVLNKTRSPEPVMTDAQWAALEAFVNSGGATGDPGISIGEVNTMDLDELIEQLELMLNRRKHKRRRPVGVV